MAVAIKLLILTPENEKKYGCGLNAIRNLEDKLIDISDWGEAMSDATATSAYGYVIKDNIVYRVSRTYFDLDNNCRVAIAKLDSEPYDIVKPSNSENTPSDNTAQ